MEKLSLNAQLRTLKGRATNTLREQSQIPVVIYGAGREPQSATVDRVGFIRIFRTAGSSGLVELTIENETVPVLIQDVQQHPISDFVTHIDFLAVDLMKEVEATIRLNFVGESVAVKALGGTLLESIDEIEVKALPTALVSHIDVDISVLTTFDDVIEIRNLKIPAGIKIDEDQMNVVVASVSAPRSEEEMAALNEAVVEDVTAIEAAKKKPEKEEGEEGDVVAKAE
ncbi:MAG: 50S ribosomal protein L25 [Candidatus Giovannonibacteria bacterium GW2011_GWA2_53_7]|uniref:Large ribosomal subunit protein bL25 n=1 Tax=Candidatus Giovannonibacteria bacterium GW2011_GWA2_53_7 TaxID=1618650 RepID=A0A0G1Y1Q0_9BACT|nr:MAG: 50S ribosomal protein L25 [Candidatus Giovannonibacteria bacterium GW2011_GWA2_53_7]